MLLYSTTVRACDIQIGQMQTIEEVLVNALVGQQMTCGSGFLAEGRML
jgi:hypothetical protein